MPEPTELALISNPAEQQLVSQLLQPAVNPSVYEELAPEEALGRLEVLCRVSAAAERIAELSLPAIGKLLLVIHAKPSFYKSLGYDNFNLFVEQHVVGKFGLSRTTAYNSIRLMRKFPEINPEVFRAIGRVKLMTLAQAFPGDEPVPKKYFTIAQQSTSTQLRERLEVDSLMVRGEADPFTIHIATNKAIGQRWWEFCKDEAVQRHCETSRADEILLHLMEECEQLWRDSQKGLRDGTPFGSDRLEDATIPAVPAAGTGA